VLDDVECRGADGSPVAIYARYPGANGTCSGWNQAWTWQSNGTITNVYNNVCLDVNEYTGPKVQMWECNGQDNQRFALSPEGLISTTSDASHPAMCLAVAPAGSDCSNVWGRKLSDEAYALGYVNNANATATVTCNAECFKNVLGSNDTPRKFVVRDLWAHKDIATISGPPFELSADLAGNGTARVFKLSPA